MDLKGKKVLVTGLGISGVATIKALNKLGAIIIVTDIKKEDELKSEIEKLKNIDFKGIFGDGEINLDDIDLIVKSPGMPLSLEIFKVAENKGIEIITDIELAFRISKAKFIAITGTNGKTTSTILMGEVFSNARDNVYITGNVGVGILSKIDELMNENSIFIIETSSFQLENTNNFKPFISLITNITPDHLDWHRNYDNYISAKAKIFQNQTKNDYTVLNNEDEVLRKLSHRVNSKLIFFSDIEEVEGVYLEKDQIIWNYKGLKETVMNKNDIKIPGRHNLQNIIGVIAVAKAFGIDNTTIRNTIKNFTGVEHRLEYVDNINGVKFYNDSKGTNVDSTIKAIEGLEGPINLIAGGKDKGGKFDKLINSFDNKIMNLIVLGETSDKIEKTAKKYGYNNIIKVKDMKEAVQEAYKNAKENYTVLLSPACASWDMYKSYEIRGKDFKENVEALKEK